MQQTITAELIGALEYLSRCFYKCEHCGGTGNEPRTKGKDACNVCGGYGFNPGGDIRDAIVQGRAAIAKAKGG